MTEAERLAAMTDDEWLANEQERERRLFESVTSPTMQDWAARVRARVHQIPVAVRRAQEQEFLADVRVVPMPKGWR